MLISPITAYVPEQPPLTKPSEYSATKIRESHQKHYDNFFGFDVNDHGEDTKPDSEH